MAKFIFAVMNLISSIYWLHVGLYGDPKIRVWGTITLSIVMAVDGLTELMKWRNDDE